MRPLPLAGSNQAGTSLGDPRWSLVVFQPVDVADTVNLETLIMTAAMFTLYGLMLVAVWGLAVVIVPGRAKKWFWPDHTKAAPYRAVARVNLALTALFLALVTRLGPAGIVAGAIVLATIGLVATFVMVTRRTSSDATSPTWQRDYFLARLSFLFITAAVPAMACFQAAFTLETGVLVRSGQLHVAAQLNAREDRIRKEMLKPGLSGIGESDEGCSDPNPKKTYRMHCVGGSVVDIVGVTVVSKAKDDKDKDKNDKALEAGWIERFLAITHVPLNDEAEDLQAALLGTGSSELRWQSRGSDRVAFFPDGSGAGAGVIVSQRPRIIRAGVSYWLAALVAAGGLGLLLAFGIMPMFLLNLYVRPGFKEARAVRAEGNLMLVGPPGAEKTSRLRADADIRVFDGRTGTVDAALAEHDDLVAVDHFEHSLDTATVRNPMLMFLELRIYRQKRVWIATTREPLDHLRELKADNLGRWSAVFQTFRLETVGLATEAGARQTLERLLRDRYQENEALQSVVLAECSMSRQLLNIGADVLQDFPANAPLTNEDVLTEIGAAAEPYYRALWETCSRDEKLALQQLSEEGAMNPRNGRIASRLLLSGFVCRDPTFRIMNETFRRFVLQAVSSDDVKAWEREGVQIPWSSYATSAATVAAGLAAALFLTQYQLFDAWVGYVPALVPAATSVGRLLAAARPKGPGPTTA